jgi:hypothetical protein
MGNNSYSKGISWIDDCRIPFVDEIIGGGKKATSIFGNNGGYDGDRFVKNTQGRFPANLLVSDDMLNDGVITSKNIRKYKADKNIKDNSLFGMGDTKDKIQMGDKGTNSRYYDIDKWFNNLIDG